MPLPLSHLKNTTKVLAPAVLCHSPPAAALITTTSYIATLLRRQSPAATALFFQAHAKGPIICTRRLSSPAAHLTPSLLATLRCTDPSVLRDTLRSLGIETNKVCGQWTGISLSRWEVLAAAVRDAPISVLACFLLSISRSKLDLLEFYQTLDTQTDISFLAQNEYCRAVCNDLGARSEWAADIFTPNDLFSNMYDFQTASRFLSDSSTAPAQWQLVYEKIAASLSNKPAHKPVILPGKYNADGVANGPGAKSDCVEVVTREIVELLLWDEESHSFRQLPASADRRLHNMYNTYSPIGGEQQGAAREYMGGLWYALLSRRKGLDYLAGEHELVPSMTNIAAALGQLFQQTPHECPTSTDTNVSAAWTRLTLPTQLSLLFPTAEVESTIVSYRAALGEEMIHEERCSVRHRGSSHSLDIVLDRTHSIATVTHRHNHHAACLSNVTCADGDRDMALRCLRAAVESHPKSEWEEEPVKFGQQAPVSIRDSSPVHNMFEIYGISRALFSRLRSSLSLKLFRSMNS